VEELAAITAKAEEWLFALREATLQLRPRSVFKYPLCTLIPPVPAHIQAMKSPCDSDHGFIDCCAVLASCGCHFHLAYLASKLESYDLKCSRCPLDLTLFLLKWEVGRVPK
jgi:hypothetical protein